MLRAQRVALYLVCALLTVQLVRIVVAEFRHNKLLVALPLLAFSSVAWSQNRWTTLQSASLLTVDLGFSVYLLKRFPRNDLLKLLIMIGAAAAAVSLLLVFAFPEYGLQGKKVEAFGAGKASSTTRISVAQR